MKNYRGMYKLYFETKNKKDVPEIATALYDSVSSIIPDFMINGRPGFIVYCDEMLHELASIREKNRIIDRMSGKLPSVAYRQFLRQAIVEEIHQSNEMENVHSTRKEIRDEMKVIENGQKGKRFDGMIRKYSLLIGRERIPLASCQDIRTLYDSFVLDEVVKENPDDAPDGLYFRKGPVEIVKNLQTIHEGVYPEEVLNDAMEHALLFLNDSDYDPLIRVAAFHYMFGYAHPFYNGNGRMTRFISSSKLHDENIQQLVALRLSYVIKSHRSHYYKMFSITNDKRNYGDMTCFVIEFLKFINEASEQVLSFLNEKDNLLQHYSRIVKRLDIDDVCQELLFILVQVSVCEGDSLSITGIAKASNRSQYIVRKHLQMIEPYCLEEYHGRAHLYRANLEMLDDIDTLG